MDLLTALLACNLYTADEPLVRAIAQSNSHSNQYAVVDPTMDYRDVTVPAEPKTLEAAKARLTDLQSQGGHPLLGLMQVRPEWMTAFGRDVAQAFDACINVSVGSAMLSAMDRECAAYASVPAGRAMRGSHRERLPVTETLTPRRACVVGRYGRAIGMPDFGLLIRLELGAQPPTAVASQSKSGSIFFSAPEATWAPSSIFVPLSATTVGAGNGPDGF